MEKIIVLMSTYNGELYIKEQIESILNQKDVEVKLIIRDDGSTDSTCNIISEYAEIDLIKGSNLGSTGSFFELLKNAPTCDYYAFADQDDIWDEDKLAIAISKISNYTAPSLYSSATRLVDKSLNFIRNDCQSPIISLGSAFVKNYVTGCTVVFNERLMAHLRGKIPDYAPFHDWWINLVCLTVGGISYYDKESHISYRQHGNNVVGGNSSFFRTWKLRFNKFKKKAYHRDIMAKELLDLYCNDISDENKKILLKIKNGRYCKELKTRKRIDNLLFRICILCNKI